MQTAVVRNVLEALAGLCGKRIDVERWADRRTSLSNELGRLLADLCLAVREVMGLGLEEQGKQCSAILIKYAAYFASLDRRECSCGRSRPQLPNTVAKSNNVMSSNSQWNQNTKASAAYCVDQRVKSSPKPRTTIPRSSSEVIFREDQTVASPVSVIQEVNEVDQELAYRELENLCEAIAANQVGSYQISMNQARNFGLASSSLTNLRKSVLFEVLQNTKSSRLEKAFLSIKDVSRLSRARTDPKPELSYSQFSPIDRDAFESQGLKSCQEAKGEGTRNYMIVEPSPERMQRSTINLSIIDIQDLDSREREAAFSELLSPVPAQRQKMSSSDFKMIAHLFSDKQNETQKLPVSSPKKLGHLYPQPEENRYSGSHTKRWIMNSHLLSGQLGGHSRQPSQDSANLKSRWSRYDNDPSPIKKAANHISQISRELMRSTDSRKTVTDQENKARSILEAFVTGYKKRNIVIKIEEDERKTVPKTRKSINQPLTTLKQVASAQESHLNYIGPSIFVPFPKEVKTKTAFLQTNLSNNPERKSSNYQRDDSNEYNARLSVQRYLQRARYSSHMKVRAKIS